MPVHLLERLPLPSLRVYTASSFVLLSISVYYALSVTSDPNWRAYVDPPDEGSDGAVPVLAKIPPDIETALHNNDSLHHKVTNVVTFMMQEPLCIWTIINMAYCMLVLLGTLIQKLVFGKLRVSEQQHIKDKFWNFIFYKFIFVFGVINVTYMDEVLLWCSWFTVLGFLHILAQLCKDRFEYLSFSPTTPVWSHVPLLGLLLTILALSGGLLGVCATIGLDMGWNTFAFMLTECLLLTMSTFHLLYRYGEHLFALSQGSPSPRDTSITRGPLSYYIDLAFDVFCLSLDLVHHLHMLLWSNIFLSMASLVILMQLRHLFHELQARLRRHNMYLWVLNHMDRNYPMASKEEIDQNSDNCAICWESMESARKLPCSHLFHNGCLSQWLQQDSSCPTCRRELPAWGSPPAPRARPAADAPPPRLNHNHLFHFDGSRYVSWLPSFSVEVTRMRLEHHHTTSQLDAMARQVQQLFPHYPLSVLVQDLRATRSVELTAENILDGRLPAPHAVSEPEPVSSQPRPQTPQPQLAGDIPPPRPGTPVPAALSEPYFDEQRTFDSPAEITAQIRPIIKREKQFSSNSHEREVNLSQRKEMLLANARRKFIEKHTDEPANSTQSDSKGTEKRSNLNLYDFSSMENS